MIDGRPERGLMSLRKFAQQLSEEFENLDNPRDHPNQLKKIITLYKSIYGQTFENEDNFLFNSEVIDEYMNLLLRYDKFYDAIEARNLLLKYFKE